MSQVDLVKTSEGLSFGEMDTSEGKLLVGAEEFSIPPEKLIQTEEDVINVVNPLLQPIIERIEDVENNIDNGEGDSSTITEEEIIDIVTPLLEPINTQIDELQDEIKNATGGKFELKAVSDLFKFTSQANTAVYRTTALSKECGDNKKDYFVLILQSGAGWTGVCCLYKEFFVKNNYYSSATLLADSGTQYTLNFRLVKGTTGVTGVEYKSNMDNGWMVLYQV